MEADGEVFRLNQSTTVHVNVICFIFRGKPSKEFHLCIRSKKTLFFISLMIRNHRCGFLKNVRHRSVTFYMKIQQSFTFT